jgi:hypothetical protein
MARQPELHDPNEPMSRPEALRAAKALADLGHEIWGDEPEVPYATYVVVLTRVLGRLSDVALAQEEGRPVDHAAARRALGNLLLTCARWADDEGLEECVQAAEQAQRDYVARRRVVP